MENVELVIMLIANFSSCFALDNHSDPLVPENNQPKGIDGSEINNAIILKQNNNKEKSKKNQYSARRFH
jgi:hypothetical protein